jgi:hypothetical protein
MQRSVLAFAHKWAAPPSPVMDAIKTTIQAQLSPIYFTIRNDISAGPWNTDQNFYGLICSPKFEGKKYEEMFLMVNEILTPLGVAGRCRFSLEPPSRWNVCKTMLSFTWTTSRDYIERNGGSGV